MSEQNSSSPPERAEPEGRARDLGETAAPKARRVGASKKGFAWRPLLRAVHRDVGYTAVGLTFVYAVSGLAVNHIGEWDPNFKNYEVTREVGGPLPDNDEEAARIVLDKLGIKETPEEVYRAEKDLEVRIGERTLHVNVDTGHVVDQGRKPRFILRVANWLHLNRGKKAWTYAADTYAAALLFLAFSGLFMLKGSKGIIGRGAVFVLIGIAIPVAYVTFAAR